MISTTRRIPEEIPLASLFLRRLVGAYLVMGLLIFAIQSSLSYGNLRKELLSNLHALTTTFGPVMAGSIWDYQEAGLNAMVSGIARHADVVAVDVVAIDGFKGAHWRAPRGAQASTQLQVEFPLVYEDASGARRAVGTLIISSSQAILWAKVRDVLVATALIGLAMMIVVGFTVWVLVQNLMVRPLGSFVQSVKAIEAPHPDHMLDTGPIAGLEYSQLRQAFVRLMGRIGEYQAQISQDNLLLETRVQDRTAQLEIATQAKGQFLANMSHEIRTPMNAILGLLTLLQNTDLTQKQRDYASKTHGAAKSLLGLLNDILDFSKAEAGKMTLESEPFQIEGLMRNLSVILSATVGTKDIDVLFDLDPAIPEVVLGDAMRLQQVLTNLGGNAVKFTEQGQVLISLRLTDRTAGRVNLHFAVADSGIGIPLEAQERIFTGFSQAEASTTRRFGGTGLGLAISQRLVELMGGQVQLTSAAGVGSTFAFTLGFDVPGQLPLEQPAPERPILPAQRALVVDDNPVAGVLLVDMLRAQGWDAEWAAGGQAALDRIEQQLPAQARTFPVDLVCMDWMMPCMDGWETSQRLRDRARRHGVQEPIVVMVNSNGRDNLSQRRQADHALIDGFLAKPTTPSMLFDAIADAQSNRAGRVQLATRPTHTPRLVGMRILVAEDNAINQQIAFELLSLEGALVSIADNGQLAVAAVLAAVLPFNVVLMDLQMPVMDGFAATKALRSHTALAHLPVIAMTANVMASDRDACLLAGMNEHVGKPFDMAQLIAVLLRVTGFQPADTAADATPVRAAATGGGAATVPMIEGIDLAAALARMSGQHSLYARAARDFSKALGTVGVKLAVAFAAKDQKQLELLLHTLKGTAGTLGLTALERESARMETLCKATDGLGQFEDCLPALALVLQDARVLLAAALRAIAPPDAEPIAPAHQGHLPNDTIPVLQQLLTLLRAGDLTALQYHADHHHTLQALNALSAPACQELELALQTLDLQAACTACEALLVQMTTDARA